MATSAPPADKKPFQFPFSIFLEKRVEDIPKWLPFATSLGSVVGAFIISGIILKLIGGQPLRVPGIFLQCHFWQLARDIGHPRQGYAADHGRVGLHDRLQNEIVEYRCGRPVLSGGVLCQPGCIGTAAA